MIDFCSQEERDGACSKYEGEMCTGLGGET